MKRQFSMATVFRMTEKALLRRFFESLGIKTDSICWDAVNRRNIQPLENLFDTLSQDKRDDAEGVLRHVHALSCEAGMEVFGEAARSFPIDDGWTTLFTSDKSLYTKSLSVWLFHRDLFETAALLFTVDSRTWWRKRLDLPMTTPTFDNATKNRLESEIEKFLKQKQGRGYVCTVEMVKRTNGTYYFIAHPDDFVRDTLVHDEDKLLVHQTVRQTFEIVFAYDSVHGTSELSAKMSKPIKEALEEIFLWNILSVAPQEKEEPPFDLSMLLDPNFNPVTKPEDRIKANVVALTVNWEGTGLTTSYLSKQGESVLEFAIKRINEHVVMGHRPSIMKAKFRFEFFGDVGRPKTMTFEVCAPSLCTLNHQDPVRVEQAQYYLKQWRIAHDTTKETIIAGHVDNDSVLLAG